MEEDKEIDLDYALNYFVDFQEKPEHVYFEHTYSQPGHRKHYGGYSNPAKYLFTAPLANSGKEASANTECIDIETVDHSSRLYFDFEKLNDQLPDCETSEYDELWTDKVDKKDWNIIKVRLFKYAVQILESDHLSRLAYKGLRDEAVKRHLTTKKSASRFKSLYGSVAWDPQTCQWLHNLLVEKLPSCLLKVYTDAFQCLETKVPAHLLEHMTILTSYMSVRSRLLGADNQNSMHKKHYDMFSAALNQNKPKRIVGEPLLILVPSNLGNSFASNSRPFRFMTELSLLGTLVTVNCPRSLSANTEIPLLLEQMIQATVSKIIEVQTDHPGRPIVLIGLGASSLLACHIAIGFNQKIAAVVCIGFHIFTMEGKIGKANDKILNMKTPVLFLIGQNASTVTIDEIEEFRLRLRCKSGLIIVGGADDHLRVNHFLKLKCSITQGIVDRCIINEIADFLNDIMQPAKVLLSILSNNDAISSKPKAAVSSEDAQLLKKLLTETVNEPNSPILQKLTQTLAQLQADAEQNSNSSKNSDSATAATRTPAKGTNDEAGTKENNGEKESKKKSLPSFVDSGTLRKVLTNEPFVYRHSPINNRSKIIKNQSGMSVQYRLSNSKKKSPIQTMLAPVNFTRKTRGGRRPYVRRTIPPKRNMVVISSYSSGSAPIEISHERTDISNATIIENLTPDNLLDMPVVFADENDDCNVINDVSLASYQ